jgi:hypothetical protein
MKVFTSIFDLQKGSFQEIHRIAAECMVAELTQEIILFSVDALDHGPHP